MSSLRNEKLLRLQQKHLNSKRKHAERTHQLIEMYRLRLNEIEKDKSTFGPDPELEREEGSLKRKLNELLQSEKENILSKHIAQISCSHQDDEKESDIHRHCKHCTNKFETGVSGLNPYKAALKNDYYRNVFFTNEAIQIVLMKLNPTGGIKGEVHPSNTQIFFIVEGSLKLITSNKGIETPIILKADEVGFVPSGHFHKLLVEGDAPVRLFTIYAPWHHDPELKQMEQPENERPL